MDILEQLDAIGLPKSAALIYRYLLEQGQSRVIQIAKGTGITASNCYHVLEGLKRQGLVQEVKEGKKKGFIASDPRSLVRRLEIKKEAIEKILPDLRALYTVQKNKPKIRFFDGFESVKEIYLEALDTDKIIAIGSTKKLTERDEAFFTHLRKQVKKRNIFVYDILTANSRSEAAVRTKEIMKGLYEAKFFPAKFSDMPIDILVWNDNIALITLEEPVFGTVLTQPYITEAFRVIFTLLWENLES
jgi:sugar-specific transcriptional regulator TrmB